MTDIHKFLTIALGDLERALPNMQESLKIDGMHYALTSLEDAIRRLGAIVENMDEQAEIDSLDRRAYEQQMMLFVRADPGM